MDETAGRGGGEEETNRGGGVDGNVLSRPEHDNASLTGCPVAHLGLRALSSELRSTLQNHGPSRASSRFPSATEGGILNDDGQDSLA
jgi:hypothetical protein